MTKLVCLHLSDLHWGHSQFTYNWPKVREKLIKDLPLLLKKYSLSNIDIVLFTGDLTNHGTREHFEGFQGCIDDLWRQLDLRDAKLLAIPGNHDLERNPQGHKDSDELALKRSWEFIKEHFWENQNDPRRTYVENRFSNYRDWWKNCPQRAEVEDGILIGDFAATVKKDGINFGFLGLNTAFLQLTGGDFEGKLDFGLQQFHQPCQSNGPEWVQRQHMSIVLTHHPVSWLYSDRGNKFNVEVLEGINIHLHGHMHEHIGKSEQTGGLPPRHRYQCASLCGIKTYKDQGRSCVNRTHGYALIVFEYNDKESAVRVYPRILEDKSGALSFERYSQLLECQKDWFEYKFPRSGSTESSDKGPSPAISPAGCYPLNHEYRVFNGKLPTVGRSEAEALEKATLFGGRSKENSLRFTAIKSTIAKHSFDRQLVDTVCEEIRDFSASVRSYSIRSPHGAGLSIALAQVVRDLYQEEHIKVFWTIDDLPKTSELLDKLSEETAEMYYSYVSSRFQHIQNIVFVIDDVSEVEPALAHNLLIFRDHLKDLVSESSCPSVTFVFGSFGDIPTLSEDGTFDLKLTEVDRNRCYEKMALHAPQMIEGLPGGVAEILKLHPESKGFRDDAQAFIDFLLEHGRPKVVAANHWLARIDDLSENDKNILAKIATSQLIGLSIEESVVKKLFSSYFPAELDNAEQLARRVRGLTLVPGEWSGIGLSCARRARSILERLSKFSFDYMRATYSELIGTALDNADKNTKAYSLEFARHIFQRLSKNEFYQFEEKSRLSRELLEEHLTKLRLSSEGWEMFEKAKWAGTLSAVLTQTPAMIRSSDLCLTETYTFILALCESARVPLSDLNDASVPRILLSLYRANRRMLMWASEEDLQSVQRVTKGLQYSCTTEDLCSIVNNILSSGAAERAYRANELVHARFQFEDAAQGKKNYSYYKSMKLFFSKVENVFKQNACEIDAANWLKKSEYVIPPKEKAKCFILAKECTRKHPITQGTWEEKIAKAVTRLIDKNPGLDELLGTKLFERLTS
ncbi:metallophosphoesterase [Hahella aquimaris]|uniref:metallophosphoesterase family protein n=1 Tax=Hahella sp. HNIBRBA332 TaxID=3015983 RepID=UPI00273CB872|nr:metallophosphoesterase [Hahella sp. HNIBRBA332]WLQ16817.1 metallophosphoesterase [Hahella sp. HNIBRBA332]